MDGGLIAHFYMRHNTFTGDFLAAVPSIAEVYFSAEHHSSSISTFARSCTAQCNKAACLLCDFQYKAAYLLCVSLYKAACLLCTILFKAACLLCMELYKIDMQQDMIEPFQIAQRLHTRQSGV